MDRKLLYMNSMISDLICSTIKKGGKSALSPKFFSADIGDLLSICNCVKWSDSVEIRGLRSATKVEVCCNSSLGNLTSVIYPRSGG